MTSDFVLTLGSSNMAKVKLNYAQRFHHGLYEVHLPVTDLDRAIDFYVSKLGFELGFDGDAGSSALLLYTHGETRSMLGLFRVDSVVHRCAAEYHISFRVAAQDVDGMVPYLRERGVAPVHPPGAPRQGPMNEPIVHGWMPAAAVFFRDPDGHLLELIADLPDAPRPSFLYRPLSEWRALVGGCDQ
ncbi:MAG: VOC family protein [Chthoniobacterales bacterium]